MGLGKIIFFIAAPIGGMTIAAFSLKKQLPKACRLFGNYIGLSYVCFKSMIKIMRPQNHMTYEMIDIARKTSQQSQALRRQLKNTVKRVKQQIKQKRDQTFKDFENQFPILKDEVKSQETLQASQNINKNRSSSQDLSRSSASQAIIKMQMKKRDLLNKRILTKESKKFHQEI